MALTIDPQILSILSELGPLGQQGPPVGDVETRRKNSVGAFATLAASRDPVPGVDRTDYSYGLTGRGEPA